MRLMTVTLLKSKLHRARVTASSVNYVGSITIAADLAAAAGLREYERVLVGNMGNGERFETYVILGAAGSGAIELNGATAHLGKPGDLLTIMSFGQFSEEEAGSHSPKKMLLGEGNLIIGES
ncbi:MAG: aspartate 1-decarboxylase [Terrimicrobiaceae bacterium]